MYIYYVLVRTEWVPGILDDCMATTILQQKQIKLFTMQYHAVQHVRVLVKMGMVPMYIYYMLVRTEWVPTIFTGCLP